MIKPILFLLLVFLLVTLSFLVSYSQLGICEDCPQTACSIPCNTTVQSNIPSNTWKYYNYTLNKETSVLINITCRPLVDYNLYANETAGECATNESYDQASLRGGCIQPDKLYFVDSPAGTYHFLVDCVTNCNLNYNLTLLCGNFCGDGVWGWYEVCDPSAKECGRPYESCRRCKCFDFRWTEAVGCRYYDFCKNGMNVTDIDKYISGTIPFSAIKPCCNDTSGPAPCCKIGTVPEKNCSTSGAVINDSISLTADPEYCYNRGYIQDIKNICIDSSWLNNSVMEYC